MGHFEIGERKKWEGSEGGKKKKKFRKEKMEVRNKYCLIN
jgi:hypothetical protein